MQVKLVLVGFVAMEDLNTRALHAYCQPITGGAETQAKDLRVEVVLLELTTFSKVPGSHSVVQSSSPQFCTIGRNIYTACTICVPLELSDQGLIVEVPDCDITIAATTEANFGIRADGQGITSWGTRCQLCLYSWSGGCQIPDGQGASFSTYN